MSATTAGDVRIVPVADDDGQERYLIFRPRLGLAFVGNGAMATLARRATDAALPAGGATLPDDKASAFLAQIGFLQPDPPLPPPPPATFAPTTAVLLMTNRCQLRCTYCYAAAGDEPVAELPWEVARAAIDYVCATALRLDRPRFEVSFHGGGEPTMAWRLLQESVLYARRQQLPAQLTLTSNGVWSPRQRAWVIHNLDGLSLSLDGAPATQNRQRPFRRGRGSAGVVLETVAALDRHDFPYGVRMTATAPWDSFPEDVRFLCETTGCHSIQVEPAFNTTRGGHGDAREDDCRAFAAAFLAAYTIAQEAGRQLHYAGARINQVTSTFCTAPHNALIVNPRGEVVACYEIAGADHPLAPLATIGRVVDGTVTIDEAARKELQARLAARRAGCTSCYCYWSCAGDCFTRTFRDGPGGHLVYGPRCLLNRTLTRQLLLHHIAGTEGVWRRQPTARGATPITI